MHSRKESTRFYSPSHRSSISLSPTTPTSPGYGPHDVAPGDGSSEAQALRKAMKGLGTDEDTLIDILAYPDPFQMALIRHTYEGMFRRSLERDIKSDTSGIFQTALVNLAGGPLGNDIYRLHDSFPMIGTITDAQKVVDVIAGRSNADLQAIKTGYANRYGNALIEKVRRKMDGDVGRLCVMLLDCNRPENVCRFEWQGVEADAQLLHGVMADKKADRMEVCRVFVQSSDERLKAIAAVFESRFGISLQQSIGENIRGYLGSALLMMLVNAQDPAAHMAALVMSVLPTHRITQTLDYKRIVYLLVRFHWDRTNFEQAKQRVVEQSGLSLRTELRSAVISGDAQTLLLKLYDGL
ncbi:hypothetical protein FE257_001088 [Aspergillus nanangensis]|uniref:Annexin n=1 Tax=Aspergillus nanangensis TaxID=2582783 RepID=A0AAD4CUA6_ASPNN|nr:hypothetical protein FE257_001088 [Aspergillus nanangensis]